MTTSVPASPAEQLPAGVDRSGAAGTLTAVSSRSATASGSPTPATSGKGELFIGLMSGTSADGIDAALVQFHGDSCSLLLGRTYSWEASVRTRLVALGQGAPAQSIEELGTLDVRVAEAFADAALRLLEDAGIGASEVRAIGSHGQTVRHRPDGALLDGNHRFTWQLGDGNLIAERSGITTVADFRRRDMAAGGQGAPLLPGLHAAMLRSTCEDRAVLNLGGIANFTLLPAGDPVADHGSVRGCDTGPANALMDAWCERELGQPYDEGGAFAARGEVDHGLLERLLADPWFALPPPKSTGREQFHMPWLQDRLTGTERPQDVQATLLELSAATIADALLALQPQTRRVLVCGGGVRNARLLHHIAARLPGMLIESTAGHGLDPDFVEAMGFAWLARRTLAGKPGNLPGVTGASGPRVLGAIYPAA